MGDKIPCIQHSAIPGALSQLIPCHCGMIHFNVSTLFMMKLFIPFAFSLPIPSKDIEWETKYLAFRVHIYLFIAGLRTVGSPSFTNPDADILDFNFVTAPAGQWNLVCLTVSIFTCIWHSFFL